MGQWTQRQYDEVLVKKVMKLFEHAVKKFEEMEYLEDPVEDKRFRTFIKDLNPNDKQTQKAFNLMVKDQFTRCSPSSRTARNSASTSMGPSGLPVPLNLPSARRLPAPRVVTTSMAARRPEAERSNLRRTESIRNLRNEVEEVGTRRSLSSRSETPINFRYHDNNDNLESGSTSPTSLSRERNNRITVTGDLPDFSIRDGLIVPPSPPNDASRSWLAEYDEFINPQSRTQSQSTNSEGGESSSSTMTRRIIPLRQPRIRRRTLHSPIFQYDSDETSVPDEFDTLLDRASSPGNSNSNEIIGRRRAVLDDDEDDDINNNNSRRRIRRRLETHPLDDIESAWTDAIDWNDQIEGNDVGTTLFGLDVRDIGPQHGVVTRDRDNRRDGVVFDEQAMATLFGEDDLVEPEIQNILPTLTSPVVNIDNSSTAGDQTSASNDNPNQLE
ncbi:uncharacterized protein L201_000539 [Kwoniella dendrophila CBS 6074]|uniref:Uncharacterized protein n=1 Tax=Kwoniella dendrophila CBS 6074 TaxID=1295534 RepID=A0AAX4JLG8_9TREE